MLTNADLQDLQGNFNLKVAKLLKIQNNKGITPLTQCVDQQDRNSFKFLFNVSSHLEESLGTKALTDSIDLLDIKQETALLKSVRTNQLDMTFQILSRVRPDDLLRYESLLAVDITQKNVLHYAVINKCKELVVKLIEMDADHSQLRKQKDSKGKLPQAYDDASLFTSLFVT